MFNHNGTYLKGIGFKYRNVEVVVEAGPDFDTTLTGKARPSFQRGNIDNFSNAFQSKTRLSPLKGGGACSLTENM